MGSFKIENALFWFPIRKLRHEHEGLSVRENRCDAREIPPKVTNDIHTSTWCNHGVQIVACQFQDSKAYLWAVTQHLYIPRSVFKLDKGPLSPQASYLRRCRTLSFTAIVFLPSVHGSSRDSYAASSNAINEAAQDKWSRNQLLALQLTWN